MILTLTSKLASMMLYVVIGFLSVRFGVLKVADSKPLSTLTVYILTPCLLLTAFQIDLTPDRLWGFIGAAAFSTVSFLVYILMAHFLKKPFHFTPVDQATLVYPNVGNLILPLVGMVLGEEMVFYASAIQIPFNLLVWTHGSSLIRGEKDFHLRKFLLNGNILAVAAGLVFLGIGFRLPDVLYTTVSGLGQMVGPASMLVVGMAIAGKDLKSIFSNKKAYLILFFRLAVFPAVLLLLLYVSRIFRLQPQLTPILQVSMMSLAAPPAAAVSQLAVMYDVEPVEASSYNVMGIFFCVLTLPAVIALYELLF